MMSLSPAKSGRVLDMYANKIGPIGRPMIKTKGKRSAVDVAERIQFLFYKQNNYSILLSNETLKCKRRIMVSVVPSGYRGNWG